MSLSGLSSHRHLSTLVDLVADIGQPCWVSGATSGALQPLDGFELRPPFHIMTPRGRNVRRIGHVIHTSNEIALIDRSVRFGLPVLSATRTLIDVASTISSRALTIAVDSALRDGLTSEDFLHGRINTLRTSGRVGTTNILAVLEGAEIIRGGQSWLEREVLRLLDANALPVPSTQVVLGRRGDKLIRVDFRFEGTPIVVEALGYRWHRSGAQMNVDAARANALVLDGYLPLQFTYTQVVGEPHVMIATIRTAFAQCGHTFS